MVEYSMTLDQVFGSLADSTRRDILKRVSKEELSVSEIAVPYNLSFAAISKHLKVLEKANLIIKRRRGKEQMVRLSPQALIEASEYLKWYQLFMNQRLSELNNYLNREIN